MASDRPRAYAQSDAQHTQDVLPTSTPKLGLSRIEAADYIGISETKFDEMVADGRMPVPKCIDRRRVWDRLALDRAFRALPDDNDRGPQRQDAHDDWRVGV